MKLIGSRRIKELYPDFPRNTELSDADYLVEDKNLPKSSGREYHVIPPLQNYEITGDVLLTLKLSHVYWNYNRPKHLFDINFLKEQGCAEIPELFNELFEFWQKKHGKRSMPDFRKGYDDFFDDLVTHKINHDDIHHAINPDPMFKKILKGDGTVDVCEDRFNALSYQDKLLVIQEECMVLVFERYYIMGIFEKHYKIYYNEMLTKLLANLSPLWMAKFIALNHKQLLTIKNLKHEWTRINRNFGVEV